MQNLFILDLILFVFIAFYVFFIDNDTIPAKLVVILVLVIKLCVTVLLYIESYAHLPNMFLTFILLLLYILVVKKRLDTLKTK